MTIPRISDEMTPDPLKTRGASSSERRKDGVRDAENNARDGANVSRLSKIVANYTQSLEEDNAVRPEKIAQFKSFVKSDSNLSDEQIDTIIARMANT